MPKPERGWRTGRADYTLALLALALSLFGLLAIYSASWVVARDTFGPEGQDYYLNRQAAALVVGVVAMAVTASIDYRWWRQWAPILFLVTILLLVAVLTPFGTSIGGAKRWLDLGPVLFQPSELGKLTFIMYLAAWFERRGAVLGHWKEGFVPFLVATAVVSALIILQPDMGTMVILAFSAATLAFVAGARTIHLVYAGILGLVATAALIKAAPYRMMRVLTFLNPSADTLGAGYHINQSLLAIGSGGWWGRGFGNSVQKFLYLPAPHTDSIFAIVAEELGFVRAGAVLALFLWLTVRGYRIARAAPDLFSRLLATGITSWLIIQALINLGAMLGVLPLTGVPLPFISYGGSSLVITLAAVGMLLNISRHVASR